MYRKKLLRYACEVQRSQRKKAHTLRKEIAGLLRLESSWCTLGRKPPLQQVSAELRTFVVSKERKKRSNIHTPVKSKTRKHVPRQIAVFYLSERDKKLVDVSARTVPRVANRVSCSSFPRSDNMRLSRATPRHSQSADDALAWNGISWMAL